MNMLSPHPTDHETKPAAIVANGVTRYTVDGSEYMIFCRVCHEEANGPYCHRTVAKRATAARKAAARAAAKTGGAR